jgi:chemotaxis protein CheD
MGGPGYLSKEAYVIEVDGRTTFVSGRGIGASARVVIGIGEMAIGGEGSVLVTHALGSCVAVCVYDPDTRVGGLLHFLLPEARINPARARTQPCAFADLGIPLLFQQAYARGLKKASCVVKLVGGADVTGEGGAGFGVGKRNALAARSILWRNGVLVKGEALGGSSARTVALSLDDGRVEISNGRDHVGTL